MPAPSSTAAVAPAAPLKALDLAQFAGHVKQPWVCFYLGSMADPSAFATKGAAEACALYAAQETAGNVATIVMPMSLAEHAPALLAECQRQREMIARLREGLTSVLPDLQWGTTDRWKGDGSAPLVALLAETE